MTTPIPTNSARFTPEELSLATGAEPVVGLDGAVVGVSTDTRTLSAGNLFVALRGERFDGHEHVEAAARAGAAAVLVDQTVNVPTGVGVFVVGDTLAALGALGRAHRQRWAARRRARRALFGLSPSEPTVIAITGSAGKTTTRQAVAELLTRFGSRVHASAGNLNNAVGIPMVLLGLLPNHDAAIVEIGTSSPGEIAYGASLTLPDIAVLTLVAAAHVEGIGDLAAIADEKGALFASLGPSAVAIANADDPHVVAQLLRAPSSHHVLAGFSPDAEVRITDRRARGIRRQAVTLRVGGSDVAFETPLLGVAGAYASAFAVGCLAAVRRAAPTGDELTQAFAPLADREGGRLVPITTANGTIVLDDGYNANRASMIASIDTATEIARDLGRRLVLVLGEMLELGTATAREHDEVGRAIEHHVPDVLIAVRGEAARFAWAAESAGVDATFVHSAADAITALAEQLRPGDLVLVKGSHGVGLDAVVRALQDRVEPGV
jgi:UDP-N-acetylmuramoyl-tripeptide--D-alanyl-D-alanine ligase